MFTLQRPRGIFCADVFKQVNFNEYPAPSYLGTRYLADAGLLPERDRMNLEKGSRLLQGQCWHGEKAVGSRGDG